MNNRLMREQKTVETMIKLYCKNNHNTNKTPCTDCSLLISYAFKRVECCKFGTSKPICGRCKIHCYKSDMREKIRNVMRTTGPKLTLRHPIMAIFHLIDIIRFR